MWIAVGEDGAIAHSEDLQTWSRATSGTEAALQCIAGAAGMWIAAGEGVLLHSADGETWQPVAVPGTVRAVCHGSAGWLAVGSAAGDAIGALLLHSPDGVTWRVVDAELPEGTALFGAGWVDGAYHVAGRVQADPDNSWPVLLRSADGATWEEVYRGDLGVVSFLSDVTCGPSGPVAIASSGRALVPGPDGWGSERLAIEGPWRVVPWGGQLAVLGTAGWDAAVLFGLPGVWGKARPFEGVSARAIASWGSTLAIAGNAGRLLFTADGELWEQASTGLRRANALAAAVVEPPATEE